VILTRAGGEGMLSACYTATQHTRRCYGYKGVSIGRMLIELLKGEGGGRAKNRPHILPHNLTLAYSVVSKPLHVEF
jgi:hypothetical protein